MNNLQFGVVLSLFIIERVITWSRCHSLDQQIKTLRRQLGYGTNTGLGGRHRPYVGNNYQEEYEDGT